MGCCSFFKSACKHLFIGVTLAIIAGILYRKYETQPGEPFALLRSDATLKWPAANYSRVRLTDYQQPDRFFFQWWNYLIYDPETKEHWNIIYQVTDFPDYTNRSNEARVSLAYFRGQELLTAVTDLFPLNLLEMEGGMNLTHSRRDGTFFSHRALTDDLIELKAVFPQTAHREAVEWSLNINRRHGVFLAGDMENPTSPVCLTTSSLYSYHSRADGFVQIGDKKVYDRHGKDSLPTYGAGSWGCDLPQGEPAIEYPWSWLWLVVPEGSFGAKKDIAIVIADGRFQTKGPLGDIYGGYGLLGYGDSLLHAGRQSQLWHNTSFQVAMQSSASEGYMKLLQVDRGDWSDFTDAYGTARLPLRQNFTFASSVFQVQVNFTSTIGDYFRAPVVIERQGQVALYSDFRAVGVPAHISIICNDVRQAGLTSEFGDVEGPVTVYDGVAPGTVEFAYAPPVDMDVWAQVERKKNGW